jgi:hypothetical protein
MKQTLWFMYSISIHSLYFLKRNPSFSSGGLPTLSPSGEVRPNSILSGSPRCAWKIKTALISYPVVGLDRVQ